MRKLFTIFLILAWLPLANANEAELSKAREAYKLGDYRTAFSIWESLAEQGNAEAEYQLSNMHHQGIYEDDDLAYYFLGITPQNYKEAFKWYMEAAEQGNKFAQLSLAGMYKYGAGTPQNYSEAVKWYTKSAENGIAISQYLLGRIYYKGDGVSQNYNKAIKWFRSAAEQGYAEAQNYLGIIYFKGEGVAKNYILAYMWTNIGKANDSKKGKELIKSIANKMTRADISKAQALATQCWESNYQDCNQ